MVSIYAMWSPAHFQSSGLPKSTVPLDWLGYHLQAICGLCHHHDDICIFPILHLLARKIDTAIRNLLVKLHDVDTHVTCCVTHETFSTNNAQDSEPYNPFWWNCHSKLSNITSKFLRFISSIELELNTTAHNDWYKKSDLNLSKDGEDCKCLHLIGWSSKC